MQAERQVIKSLEELSLHYGESAAASLAKELDYVSDHYRQMIQKSPFVVLATVGSGGLDCSPRGDAPGFVRVHDDKTLLLPDRRGNNRLDSIKNLIEDPRASLLFLIPGVGETLRVNGRAAVIRDDSLQQSFAINGKVPVTIIEFTVERIYFQCQKALVRSKLWGQDYRISRDDLPSIGQIIKSIKADFDGDAYDNAYPERLKKTLY